MGHEEETRSLGELVELCEGVLQAASPRAKLAFGAAMWQLVRGADGETIPKAAAEVEKSVFKAGSPAETLLRALVVCGGVIEYTDDRGTPVWSLATPSLTRDWPRLREFISANSALLKTCNWMGERARIWVAGGGLPKDLIGPGPDLDACRVLLELMSGRLLQTEIMFIEACLAEEDRQLSKHWKHRLKKRLRPLLKFMRSHPVACLIVLCMLVLSQVWHKLPLGPLMKALARIQKDFSGPSRADDPSFADIVSQAKKPKKPKLPGKPDTKAKGKGEKGPAPGAGSSASEGGSDDSSAESESSESSRSTTGPAEPRRRLTAVELARTALKRIDTARRAGSDPGPSARMDLWQSLSMGMDQGPICTGSVPVLCAAFHPLDGSILTGDGSGWLRAWNRSADGRPVQLRQTQTGLRDIRLLCVASDGSVAAIASTGEHRLFDARAAPKAPAAKPPKAAVSVSCSAMSSDAVWLAVAADGKAVRVSRTGNASQAIEFTSGIQSIVSLAVTQDGAYLACGGEEGEVEIWDVQEKMMNSLLQVGSRVLALRFSENGARLAAVGADGSLASWNRESPTKEPMRVQGREKLLWARFGDSSDTVGEVGSDGFQIVDLKGVPRQVAVPLPEADAQPLALSPDGLWLATLSPTGGPRLVAVGGSAVPAPDLESAQGVRALAFNSVGDRLVTEQDNRTLQVWDLSGRRVGSELRGLEKAADRVAFTTRGANVLAVSEREMKLYSWRLASGALVTVSADFEAKTTRAAPVAGKLRLARGGRYMATLLPPAAPRVYETKGRPISAFEIDPTAVIVDMDFDRAASRLATLDASGSAKVWGLNGKKLFDCPKPLPLPGALAWDGTGDQLALVGARGGLLWKLKENVVSATWKDAAGPLDTVAFHPTEPLVATRARTGKTLMRMLDGALAAPPFESGLAGASAMPLLPGSLAFSPDGRLLAFVSANRRVRLQRCGLEDAIRAATSRLSRLDSASALPIATGAAPASLATTRSGLGSDF